MPNLALVGAILNQTPAADSVVPKIGTAVRITVGVPGQVDIPNVVGKPEAEARALMAGVPGVSWAIVGGTPAGAAGTVQGQTAAGLVNIGTGVTVNVYGPEAAPPPPRPRPRHPRRHRRRRRTTRRLAISCTAVVGAFGEFTDACQAFTGGVQSALTDSTTSYVTV